MDLSVHRWYLFPAREARKSFNDPSREAAKEKKMATVLDAGEIGRALKRIAHEIIEHNRGLDSVVLLGIPTRGAFLGERIAQFLDEIQGPVPAGTLDITLHRDDLRMRPPRPLLPTLIPVGGIEGKDVVLVDDVLFSGRTIRAALDALGEIGRPRTVQLAVLVDRGHRELPIRADYVGKNIPTAATESVKVRLSEIDGEDGVEIVAAI
jgi:pyrimidine operon attenuation protein/uracil phosphoribosyltransferase